MEIARIGPDTGSQTVKKLLERVSSCQSFAEKILPLHGLEQLKTSVERFHIDSSRFEKIARSASHIQADFRSARELCGVNFSAIDHLRKMESLNLSLSPFSDAVVKTQEQISKLLNSLQPPLDLAEQFRRMVTEVNLDKTLTASIADAAAISGSIRKSFELMRSENFTTSALFSRPQYQNLTQRLSTLARNHNAFWDEINRSTTPFFELIPELAKRPSIELYQATNLFKSFGETTTLHRSRRAEQALDEDSAGLEDKLAKLDTRLINVYRGAKISLRSPNPDRERHFAVSLRELVTHTLHALSPDDSFDHWNKDPYLVQNGKPTRKGRLLYICRFVNQGAFGDFLNADLKATVEFIGLFQEGTHSLEVRFSEKQLIAMMRRAEGLISYLLDIGTTDNQ